MLVRAQGRAVRVDMQHLDIPPRGEVRRSEHHAPLLWIRLWIDGLEMMLAITVTENNPFDKLFGGVPERTTPSSRPPGKHQPQTAAEKGTVRVVATGTPSTTAEAVSVTSPAGIEA